MTWDQAMVNLHESYELAASQLIPNLIGDRDESSRIHFMSTSQELTIDPPCRSINYGGGRLINSRGTGY